MNESKIPKWHGIVSALLFKQGWVGEFKFHPVRKWRADLCHPEKKVIIEINGGVWIGGRHTSGSGFVKDMEKLNAAAILGYRILQYTPQQFKDGLPLSNLEEMFKEPF